MNRRIALIALVVGIVLVLAGGVATASSSSSWNWMDRMHDSPWMQQMRDQMPTDLQQKCDELHAQMQEWLQQHPGTAPGGMMGGWNDGSTPSGMMGGGMMGGAPQ
jgi:cytochrome c-type biogenesis protein CcmH/NrfG